MSDDPESESESNRGEPAFDGADKPEARDVKIDRGQGLFEVSAKDRGTTVERYLRTAWGTLGARAEGSWRSDVIEQLARLVVDRSEAAGREALVRALHGQTSTLPLEGAIQQAISTARIAAEQLPRPEMLQGVHSSLPQAIERYAAEGATREEIADLVAAATRPFVGSAARAELAAVVFGFVRGEARGGWGVLQTETVEAGILAQSPNLDDRYCGIIAYHLVLRDAHQLLSGGRSTEDSRRLPMIIVECCNNIAATLAELRTKGRELPTELRKVIRELAQVAAMTAASPGETHERAAQQLAQELGLDVDPVQLSALLGQLGGVPSSWPVDDAGSGIVLNAASALSSVVTGSPTDTPSRFFNAALSLIGSDGADDARSTTFTEVTFYVLALLWAAEAGDYATASEVLTQSPAARRSSVNLAIELARNASPLPESARREMLGLLVETVGPMRIGIPEDLVRILNSGRGLGIAPTDGAPVPTKDQLENVGNRLLDLCEVPEGESLWTRSLSFVGGLCILRRRVAASARRHGSRSVRTSRRIRRFSRSLW